MNPQKEFDVALVSLTPEERSQYTKANQNVNVGGTNLAVSGGQYVPQVNTNPVITSDSISNTEKPFNLSEPRPATGFTSLGADAVARAETNQARYEQSDRLKQDQKSLDTSRSLISDFQRNRKSETQLQDEASVQVDTTEADLRDINNQILQEQQSARRQVESLRKNPGGLFGGALEQEVRKVENESIAKLADLSIIQLARQGAFDSAKAIADRKVKAQMEQQQNELNALLFDYQENKDLFTKTEQREYEQYLSNQQRELDREEDSLKQTEQTKQDLLKLASSQGAPVSVLQNIQSATSPEEAIIAAGKYSVDIQDRALKELQIRKLGVELDKEELDLINSNVNQISPYQQERQSRILSSIGELYNRVSPQTVGFASLARFLPGSLPKNFKTDLDTLKASIAFGELTAMREASKTGGALGPVSDIELALLENALGGLDQSQSPANFKKNLDKIRLSIQRWQAVASGLSEEDQLRSMGYSEEQIQQIKSAQ